MSRFRHKLLPLVAAWLVLPVAAADFAATANGGFVYLDDGETGGQTPTAAALAAVPSGRGVAPQAVRLLPPVRRAGGWVLYLHGWPENAAGVRDLLVSYGTGARAGVVRLPGAVTIAPRRLDVALLLDDSHSMRTTDPARLRVAAARLFARMAAARGDVRTLTIVSFNRRARLLLPPTPPGDSAAVESALARLEAAGATDLDSALAMAGAQLEQLPESRKIAIVLSDGRDEPGDYRFEHRRFSARRWPIHTIGLSDEIDEETLKLVAASTGGRFHRAANVASLAGIFRDIAASLRPGVLIGEWPMAPAQTLSFPVDDTLRLLSLALVERATATAACALRAPDGVARALSTGWAADAFAEIFTPATGAWQCQGGGAPALLSVTGESTLDVIPFPVPATAPAGAPLPVAALAMQGDALLTNVSLTVERPDAEPLRLRDDGQSADGDAGDGIFGGYLPLPAEGVLRLQFVARGRTAGGLPFQRLAARSVAIAAPVAATPHSPAAALAPAAASASDTPHPAGARPGAPAAAPVATNATLFRALPQAPAGNVGLPEARACDTLAPLLPTAPTASALIAADHSLLPVAPPTGLAALRHWLSQFNLWHLLALMLSILLLAVLIARLFARLRTHAPRLTGYFAASLLLHLLLALLVTDLLVQTRTVKLEQISPSLAVTVQAIEQATGIALTPPGPAVPWRDRMTPAHVARTAPPRSQDSPPSAPELPVMEADAMERALAAATAIAARPDELQRIMTQQTRLEAQLDNPRDALEPPRQRTATAEKRPELARRIVLGASAADVEETDSPPAPATPDGSTSRPADMPTDTPSTRPETLVARLVDMQEPMERALPATPATAADTPAMPAPRTAARGETANSRPAPLQQPLAAQPAASAATAVTTLRPAAAVAPAKTPAITRVAAPALPPVTATKRTPEPVVAHLPAAPEAHAEKPEPAAQRVVEKTTGERKLTAPAALVHDPAAATTVVAPAPPSVAARPSSAAATATEPRVAVAVAPVTPSRVAAPVHAGERATKSLPFAPAEIADRPVMPAQRAVVSGDERQPTAPAIFKPAPAAVATAAMTPTMAARPGGVISTPGTATALVGAAAPVEPPGKAAAAPRAASASVAAALPGAPATVFDEPVAAVPRVTTEQAAGSGRPAGPTAVAQAPAAPAASASAAAAGAVAARPAVDAAPATSAVAPLHAPAALPAAASAIQPVADNQLSFKIGAGGAASRRFTIGLARYGGDWDWARLAMTYLGHQIRERTRLALNAEDRVIAFDSPDLSQLPFVYMTGHRDFRFTEVEVANLRSYLQGGGYLWADDSTHYQDETFDQAFRRELARVLPRARLERLDMTFPGFRTGYDLTRGYKGYAVPPGDKYRLDYIEGARVGDRVAVVYTRNDYGDGLNIDEHTHPLQVSLTDLSPAEMQEGAVRMGVNLTLYFLTHGKADMTFLDQTGNMLRQVAEAAAPAMPEGLAQALPGFVPEATWETEKWSDPGTVTALPDGLTWDFTVAAQGKCAISLPLAAPLAWTARDVVAIDVTSNLRGGARLGLGVTVGGRYFESRPAYLKPGANVALFPCGERAFKSEAGGWQYRDALPLPGAIERLTLLVYSPTAGRLRLTNARLVSAK